MQSKMEVGHEDPSAVIVMNLVWSESLPEGKHQHGYLCENEIEFLLLPSVLLGGAWRFEKSSFDYKRKAAIYIGHCDVSQKGRRQ